MGLAHFKCSLVHICEEHLEILLEVAAVLRHLLLQQVHETTQSNVTKQILRGHWRSKEHVHTLSVCLLVNFFACLTIRAYLPKPVLVVVCSSNGSSLLVW